MALPSLLIGGPCLHIIPAQLRLDMRQAAEGGLQRRYHAGFLSRLDVLVLNSVQHTIDELAARFQEFSPVWQICIYDGTVLVEQPEGPSASTSPSSSARARSGVRKGS